MYVTDLAAAKKALSLDVTEKCVTNSYTSLAEPSIPPAYTSNPSSARAAAYQREGYARVVTCCRQEVTYSLGAYGTNRPTP